MATATAGMAPFSDARANRFHSCHGSHPARTTAPLSVAVVGSPTADKAALLNALANSRFSLRCLPSAAQEPPGLIIRTRSHQFRLFDLPDIYTLSPTTRATLTVREFLTTRRPDLVVHVINASDFRRSLYLTLQLMEFGIPVMVTLSPLVEPDVKENHRIARELETVLGVRVLTAPTSGKLGINRLVQGLLLFAEGSIPRNRRSA